MENKAAALSARNETALCDFCVNMCVCVCVLDEWFCDIQCQYALCLLCFINS